MNPTDWVRYQMSAYVPQPAPSVGEAIADLKRLLDSTMRRTKDTSVSRYSSSYEVKLVDIGAGTFDGYGATWDLDRVGERIVRGAFAASIRKHGGRVPLLWQHHAHSPIGVAGNLVEDEYGLKFRGEVSRKAQRGEEALDLIRIGGLKSFSIGYCILRERQAGNVRELLEVDLAEISIVSIPANSAAGLAA